MAVARRTQRTKSALGVLSTGSTHSTKKPTASLRRGRRRLRDRQTTPHETAGCGPLDCPGLTEGAACDGLLGEHEW